jgi:hypothetical protein
MPIFRRIFLGLITAAALGVVALSIAAALYFKPQLRSTHISPDGRFKVVIYTVPSLTLPVHSTTPLIGYPLHRFINLPLSLISCAAGNYSFKE